MTKNSIRNQFIRYSSLNALGMIALSCYILADTFFVANRLGANGLTALNIALPVYSFIHGSGLMLGMGGATKFSICAASQKRNDANYYFTNVLYLFGILSLIFVLAGIFFSSQITTLLGADRSVFSMSKTYLQVILLFSPAFLLNDILICFVRNDKNPRLSMIAMISGSLSNVVLDYVFLYPLNMGIFGAVLATGFAPVISILFLSLHMIQHKNTFSPTPILPDIKREISIVLLGVSSLITEFSSGIVMIVFNHLLLTVAGNVGIAAYGIIANLSLVLVSIFTGIAQGMQPLLSHACGEKNHTNIQKLLHYGILSSTLLACCTYAILFAGVETVTNLFNSENNLALHNLAVHGLKLYFISAPFTGFNIILTTFFSSTERALPSQILSLLRGLFLIIPIAFVLSYTFGINGIWLTLPLTEALVSILALFIQNHGKKVEISGHTC